MDVRVASAREAQLRPRRSKSYHGRRYACSQVCARQAVGRMFRRDLHDGYCRGSFARHMRSVGFEAACTRRGAIVLAIPLWVAIAPLATAISFCVSCKVLRLA